ncbi:hypothetical protein JAAARDRAFT_196208 [Jaapia argillacea MUCL 33604]|uniref:Calpain catalytic domain-containing protein n=1 Tax=Jaapia argillacea MUCL 33604 TaxID=933084 RepID=A0A067PIS2_9AGAM|nr:hypothetical protein JAAARDRAFT_196208 [Jaapia argillacea MUCL 33604]
MSVNVLKSITSPVMSRQSSLLVPLNFDQRKDQAGLLVTEELDKAIERCKKRVEGIAKECRRRNSRFRYSTLTKLAPFPPLILPPSRDIEFDLDNDQTRCLYGLSSDHHFTTEDVRRVSQIFDNPEFFKDTPGSNDIAQSGILGDCWFVSALVVASTVPHLIEKICVARDEKVGVYGFIFFRDAGWQEVIIDDLLCSSVPLWESLNPREQSLYKKDKDAYNSTARKGSKSLAFAKSGKENETWVPLIEKAYAKLYGDYAALEGGIPGDAIEDLTGGVTTLMPLIDILDEDEFWNKELLRANQDRLLGCGIMGPEEQVNGIFTTHAYSIIQAMEVKGKRFVKIRNPWGHSEWTGRWSDGSKEWTNEWLQALPELGHSFGNDGVFLMEYKDFLSTWTNVSRTIIFNSSWMMSSQWLDVTSRSFPCAWGFGDVSFTISVPQPTPAVIVLSRLNDRHFEELSGCYDWALDFVLFRKGDTEPIGSSVHDYFMDRSVSLELDLDAGEYVVHVRLDRWLVHGRSPSSPVDRKDDWDPRKLARKFAGMVTSASIATNFDPSPYADFLPIQSSPFAGQDISEIEVSSAAVAAASKVSLDPVPDNAIAPKPQENAPSLEETKADVKVPPATADDGKSKDIQDGDNIKPAPSTEPAPVIHHGVSCDGCGVSLSPPGNVCKLKFFFGKMFPIVGPRYRCLDPSCNDFDLCQKCMDAGKHPSGHPFLCIAVPLDQVERTPVPDKFGVDDKITARENHITLGLRVYTMRQSPAMVKGQLRHGNILHWSKQESKTGDVKPPETK